MFSSFFFYNFVLCLPETYWGLNKLLKQNGELNVLNFPALIYLTSKEFLQ